MNISIVTKITAKLRQQARESELVFKSNILSFFGVILLIIGASISLYDWHANEVVNQHAAQLVYDANHGIKSAAPGTHKPGKAQIADYVVAPSLPRYLIIPTLGVDTPILQVGLNDQGAIDTPDNVFETAWYDASAKPGQLGAMLIDGHISSWTSPGVFYAIDTLQPGDDIMVQSGNGAIFTYEVVRTQIYNASDVDMASALAPVNPIKPGLNLISCTGSVITGTSQFNERIIVFAQFASN